MCFTEQVDKLKTFLSQAKFCKERLQFLEIYLFSCTASHQRFTSYRVLFSSDAFPSTALASLFSAQKVPEPSGISSMNTLSSPCAHVNTSILRLGFPYLTALCILPILLPCDEFSVYRKGYWSLKAWFPFSNIPDHKTHKLSYAAVQFSFTLVVVCYLVTSTKISWVYCHSLTTNLLRSVRRNALSKLSVMISTVNTTCSSFPLWSISLPLVTFLLNIM